MTENREKIIPIRVTELEFDIIKRLSSKLGLSLSATMRNATLDKAEERGIVAIEPRKGIK